MRKIDRDNEEIFDYDDLDDTYMEIKAKTNSYNKYNIYSNYEEEETEYNIAKNILGS